MVIVRKHKMEMLCLTGFLGLFIFILIWKWKAEAKRQRKKAAKKDEKMAKLEKQQALDFKNGNI